MRSGTYRFGQWHVEPERNRIVCGDVERQLEPLGMDLLVYLLKHPDQTVSADQLLNVAWANRVVEPNAVPRVINQLRGALGDDSRQPRYIETIRKQGYRTVAPVHATENPQIDGAARSPLLGPAFPEMGRHRVALLPFQHSAGDDGLAALAESALDALVTELAAKKTLKVADPERVQTGDYVLRGRLDRDVDRVRISVRLTASSDDSVLWSQVFEQPAGTQGFANVAQVAALVEGILPSHWRLTNIQVAVSPRARLENFQGEVEFTRWAVGAGGNMRVAADHWRCAVDLAPTFWPAQRQLANYHANRFEQEGPLVDYLPVAHASARALLRAAALDHRAGSPARPVSSHALGKVLHYLDLDYDGAERLYLAARRSSLMASVAEFDLGMLHLARGDVGRAMGSLQTAIGREPSADVCTFLLWLGQAQIAAGQYSRARESAERAATHVRAGTYPHFRAQLLSVQSGCLLRDGECAGSMVDDLVHTYGDTRAKWLPDILALTGRTEAAARALEEMERRHEARRLNHYWSSFLGHYHLGNLDAAFLWLDRVIENREVLFFGELRLAPYLAPLREDARFAAAMQRLAELESRVSPLRAEAMKLLD